MNKCLLMPYGNYTWLGARNKCNSYHPDVSHAVIVRDFFDQSEIQKLLNEMAGLKCQLLNKKHNKFKTKLMYTAINFLEPCHSKRYWTCGRKDPSLDSLWYWEMFTHTKLLFNSHLLWYDNQPDKNSNEFCLEMRNELRFNDAVCYKYNCVICEAKASYQ